MAVLDESTSARAGAPRGASGRTWFAPVVGGATVVWCVLGVLVTARAGTGPPPTSQAAQVAVAVVVAAVQGTALTWRRTRPVLGFVVTLLATCVLMVATHDRAVAVTPAYLAAVAALALHARGARLVVAVLAGVVVEATMQFVLLLRHGSISLANPYDFAGPLLNVLMTYTACLAAGQLVLAHRHRAAGMLEQVARLEREQEAAAQEAVLSERRRMARELHDVTAHHLTAIVVQGRVARLRAEDPAARDEALESIVAHGLRSLASLRQIVAILRYSDEIDRPPQHEIGDVPALLRDVDHVLGRTEVHVDGDLDDLPDAVHLAAYRIVQESVSNVARHAPHADVRVAVRRRGADVELEVVNSPSTHAPSTDGQGLGLTGMRERVELLGGSLRVGPTVDGGWRVHALLTPSLREAPP
ncbi:sensor histidine kinase [Cellulomonas telluris]|uniref:sensor histidine kinase n=1 Tax=Cellulomonas telluris TaxID=2306636 RepID=UPI0010A86BA0|nr:histidine kinase [Cellulomonas telluris]